MVEAILSLNITSPSTAGEVVCLKFLSAYIAAKHITMNKVLSHFYQIQRIAFVMLVATLCGNPIAGPEVAKSFYNHFIISTLDCDE